MLFDKVRKRLGDDFLAKTQAGILSQTKFWLPTGAYNFDWAMGKGWPMGRIIEMFGEESKGKTTLGILAIRQAQLFGGMGYFINSEHTFEPKLATSLGADVSDRAIKEERFGYSDVKYISEAFNAVDAAMDGYLDEFKKKKKKIDDPPGPPFVIVLDSVAALKADMYKGIMIGETRSPGANAREISEALRDEFSSKLIGQNIVLIVINHIYEKMGVLHGPKTTSTGGRKLKFMSDIRLEVSSAGKINDDYGAEVGVRIEIEVVKSKVSIPRRVARMSSFYVGGIDDGLSVFEFLKDKGAIVYSKSEQRYISLADGEMYAREEEFVGNFNTSQKFRDKVLNLVDVVLRESPRLRDNNGKPIKWSPAKKEKENG